MKPLSAIRAIVRQFLNDEFVSGSEQDFQDDELDLYISDCLAEISERKPYEVKETLTTTANSKELDISSIDDLLDVDEGIDKIEYPVGNEPPEYHDISVFGDTLRMEIDSTPGDAEDVYFYCRKVHQLTESSSTLNPRLERLLVNGTVAYAALGWAKTKINAVNVGGGRTAADLSAWAVNQLALYRAGLTRMIKPKTSTRYPTS